MTAGLPKKGLRKDCETITPPFFTAERTARIVEDFSKRLSLGTGGEANSTRFYNRYQAAEYNLLGTSTSNQDDRARIDRCPTVGFE